MQNKVPHNLKSDPPPPPNFTAKISVVVVFFLFVLFKSWTQSCDLEAGCYLQRQTSDNNMWGI